MTAMPKPHASASPSPASPLLPLLRPSVATRVPADARPAGRPALVARDFQFGYRPGQTVLKGISLEIQARAVTAIIGPSGCGKSTFLRSINRMHDLIPGAWYKGEIALDGTSIFSAGTDLVALRQRVGMVFQRPNPFPKSIYDNVAYGPALNRLVPKSELPEVVERCLRKAALWDEVKDRLDSLGTSLSGGQQQRLCIARALGNQPEILLMDEPCSALDPLATARVEDLIDALRGHYTIVIVTHNMQQAARVSDNTAFMYMGRLVEYGDTETIFTRPRVKTTSEYVTGRFG